jgi:hypothetical protein
VRKETKIKIGAYIHQSIKREGVRDFIQLNAVPFEKDDAILPDLRLRLPNWHLGVAAALKDQRWERWSKEMEGLSQEAVEALRILTLDGPSNDENVMPRLQRMRLAQNVYVVLPGLTRSPFVQVAPGQPPANRQRDHERMYEVKAESREFLEQYFGEHPPAKAS